MEEDSFQIWLMVSALGDDSVNSVKNVSTYCLIIYSNFPTHLNLIVLLPQVMKRSASTSLSGASSPKAARIDKAHPDQSKTILDNALAVFQRLTDLGSATFNLLELSAACQIGIQIVEIINVRPKTLFFDERI
jgi:hypothetical protein